MTKPTLPIFTQEPIKIQVEEFTGTLESFEKMVKHLSPNPHKINYQFLDKNFKPCSMFHGIVQINNAIYQKGDHYSFRVVD